MQSQKTPIRKNLYSHHLAALDEYLKSELAFFMTHSNLTQLMVTAVMLPKFLEYRLPIMNFLSRGLSRGSFKIFSRACQQFLFASGWSIDERYMAKYHTMLSEFLGDPTRSKEFYIDGDKFATLATAFVKQLFGPSM